MFTNFGTLPFDGQIAYVAVYDIAYASNRMKPWAFALATELCDDQDIVCQVRTQLAYRIESERLMELARLSMDPRKQQQDQWYETFAQLKRGEAWDRRNVKVEIQ